VSPAEAGWVTGRVAELLEWPLPTLPELAGPKTEAPGRGSAG